MREYKILIIVFLLFFSLLSQEDKICFIEELPNELYLHIILCGIDESRNIFEIQKFLYNLVHINGRFKKIIGKNAFIISKFVAKKCNYSDAYIAALSCGTSELLNWISELIIEGKLERSHLADYSPRIITAQGLMLTERILLISLIRCNILNDPALINELFRLGARYGYYELTKFLINHDIVVDCATPSGQTALMLSARAGRSSIVRLLLANRAAINQCDYFGYTALMHAAENGQQEIVKLLIAYHADPLVISKRKLTARNIAAQQRNCKIAYILKEYEELYGLHIKNSKNEQYISVDKLKRESTI